MDEFAFIVNEPDDEDETVDYITNRGDNIMSLTCLFITRPYEPNSPELLVAWDEYSIDGYPEGFAKECDKALKAVGSDILNKAYVTVKVDEDAIMKILRPSVTIAGVISD